MTLACFHRNPLDFVATTQRQTAVILAAMAMGKCEMGGVWAPLEQRHSPMRPVWHNTSHNGT